MAETWATYRQSIGDRSGLFVALAERWPVRRALYPGSYLDLAPSTAIPDVTYVDTDRRAAAFFADTAVVRAELQGRLTCPGVPVVRFVRADYREPLPLPDASVDLVVSLYAGLVWDATRRYLRPGGWLLANNSHGDASVAALDPDLTLVAAVTARGERFALRPDDLDTWLVPKRAADLDADRVRARGRGVAFTRTAFAYVFQCG